MNPGAIEEGSKVATSIVDNLKGQPVTLALVVFNLCFIAAVYFGGLDQRERQEKLTSDLLAAHAKTQESLTQCLSK